METIKAWIVVKFEQLLTLLGIKFCDWWLFYRAAIKEVGQEKADFIFIEYMILKIDFSEVCTEKNSQLIIAATQPNENKGD